MAYKYTSRKNGRVIWFHTTCAAWFNSTAGYDAEETKETPPKGTHCEWCHKPINWDES